MATVLLDKVSKRFPRHVWALRELSLEVRAGELLTVLGPSGCGKTTTLRLIAGLTMPTTGRVYIDGKDMLGVPPHRRGVDMVFQTPALYPHLRVRENLVFGVQGLYNTFGRWFRRPAADEVRRRVEPVVDLLEIGHLLDRQPAELSGGERQRIALGRALIRRPAVFLLDEPLAHVDAPLRGRIRQELKLQQRQTGATWLWVTHDQSEALALGDRVAVMHGGRLEQVDVPQRILQSPASRHVAVLVGSPPMNLLTGRLGQGGFESSAGRLSCKDESPRTETVILGIRPQHLRPCRDGEPGFAAQVLLVECDEDGWVVTGQAGAARLVWRVSGGPPAVGETMHVTCDWDQVQLFDPDTGRRLPHTGSTA